MPDFPMMNPPRELTPQEAEDRAKAMFALHRQIVDDIRRGRVAMWDLAEHVTEFCDEAGWAALGYDKIGEWLADPEINMTRRTCDRLRSVFTNLTLHKVSRAKMIETDLTKVDIVMPAIRARHVKVDDALEDTKELGAHDLRVKYLGAKDEFVGQPAIDGDGDLIERDPGDDDEEGREAPEGWKGSPGPPENPALNTHRDNSGQLPAEPEEEQLEEWTDRILLRIWNEVAPKAKKHMAGELRNELYHLLELRGLDV